MNYTRLLWGKDLQCTKFQVDSAPVIVVGVILLLVPVFFYSCMKIYGGRKEKEIIRRKSLGLHRLEKYLNLVDFLEKSLKIKSALKSTGKSLKNLEKSLNSTIFS